MKVCVVTLAIPLLPERLYKVFESRKAAEKALRKKFPFMKKDGEDSYIADKNTNHLIFLHDMEVEN